jgi:tetratricopeptide (TPR) repeat protein
VALPGELFLRHPSGDAIGPLPLRTIEVLYDARVLDESTPVSEDGDSFAALSQWPELYSHVEDVKERLGRGEKLWAKPINPALLAADLGGPLLRQLLVNAIGQVSGHLRLESSEGDLTVTYKDGKIVAVDTEIEMLSLASYLLGHSVCDQSAIDRALERAPAMGGDLGGALISLGVVQPHVYFEKLIAWALFVLGRSLGMSFESAFTPAEIPNPPVPLGFDRFGVLLDIVRAGFTRQELQERLARRRGCPVIIANVEGAKIEQMKLKPKELRALNTVNGVKTLGQLIEEMEDPEDKGISALRAIFFASECGFVVFGEDAESKRELVQAEEVRRTLAEMRRKNYLDLFNVTEKSSDEEVRARYTELAKKYHPDTLRQDAVDELREVHGEIFAFINQTFEAIQTETQRFEYKAMHERGETGGTDDLMRVQNTLHAETLFKKAEILVKVRKYDEAMEHIQEAIVLNPEDKEFRIYLAYVEYMVRVKMQGGSQTEAGEVAIRKIQTLLKAEPNIAAGYLLLGHLNKAVGKPEVATKYFEKVLEYDANHQEASREVRLHNMRKSKGGKKKGLFGI